MDFETWTLQGKDIARRKRMAFSLVLGVAVVAAAVGGLAATSEGIKLEEVEEEVHDVQLATEPEPEPEPEPEIEEQKKAPPPKFDAPKEIPKEAPKEAEPEVNPYEGDPLQYGIGQSGADEGKPAVVEAPVEKPKPKLKPKPKPKGPVRLSEQGTPPECPIRPPDYPAEAKAAGIQGTVIVRYIVSETGEVSDARAVRGPAELKGAAVAVFQGMRCKAGLEGGQPVSVIRMARFPFTLK